MILDQLSNSARYTGLGQLFNKGFEYLQQTDWSKMEPGRYNIEGDKLFALVSEYETKNIADARFEAHQKFADIQYMISGSECMGWMPNQQLAVSQPYNVEKDIEFYDAKGQLMQVDAGMFAVFFPEDAHQPSVSCGEKKRVKKVVIKVQVNN